MACPNIEMVKVEADDGEVSANCELVVSCLSSVALISKFVSKPVLCYITLVPLLVKQPIYHFIPVRYESIQCGSVIVFLELYLNTINELEVQNEHSFTEFFQLLPLLTLVLVALI